MERAVDLDAEQCLREGELSEELRVSRKEVVGMFLEEYDAELHERILRQKEYFNPYITGTLLCFSVRRNPCRMDLILQKTVSQCLRICYIKMESHTVPESMITLIYKGE